jgi:lipopolysaccharide export system protein LptA
MKQHFRQHLVIIACMVVAGFATAAETEAPAERITAKADRLELDQQTGVQTLSGNVVITQGDIEIYGDSIQVAMRNGAISRIYGSGEPIRFQQRLVGGEIVQTESSEIDYLTSSWTLVFRGNVVLQRGQWQLGGHVVEYNIRNRNFSASGQSGANQTTEQRSGSRVSITYNR